MQNSENANIRGSLVEHHGIEQPKKISNNMKQAKQETMWPDTIRQNMHRIYAITSNTCG